MSPRKTVTLNLGQAGGSPKKAIGSLKLKLKKGPLSKAFLRGFDKLIRAHGVGKDFDVALAVRPKRDMEPSVARPRFMMSHQDGTTFFGDVMEEWGELREGKPRRRRKKVKDMDEFGAQGPASSKVGLSDPGDSPPTLGFPSS